MRMKTWDEIEKHIRDRLFVELTSAPEFLLLTDTRVFETNAHVVLANLLGFNGGIDSEIRLVSVPESIDRAHVDDTVRLWPDGETNDYPQTVRYRLQSGYVSMVFDPIIYDLPMISELGPTGLMEVALVIYRREGEGIDGRQTET